MLPAILVIVTGSFVIALNGISFRVIPRGCEE